MSENPPAWEYVLSHHTPEHWDRTLRLTTRRSTWHFCARCTGQLAGFGGWLALARLQSVLPLARLPLPALAVVAALPLLAGWDWVTQSMGRRESTNALRFASGLLLGVGFAVVVELLLTARWEWFLGSVAVLALYLGVVLLILWRSGAWVRVVEQHFPGTEITPPK